MLDDVAVDGEVFDEDFFAYREDADLAWRAQLLGWDALYVPGATATHVRRVTPERRSALPAAINRYGVRNRFLLRLKNQTAGQAARFAAPGAGPRPPGGRLRAGPGVGVDARARRRRPPAAAHAGQAARDHGAARPAPLARRGGSR